MAETSKCDSCREDLKPDDDIMESAAGTFHTKCVQKCAHCGVDRGRPHENDCPLKKRVSTQPFEFSNEKERHLWWSSYRCALSSMACTAMLYEQTEESKRDQDAGKEEDPRRFPSSIWQYVPQPKLARMVDETCALLADLALVRWREQRRG